jgi:molybdopterin biosynthesis enzyme
LSRSDGLLVIPEGVEQVESGERCDVQVIRDL